MKADLHVRIGPLCLKNPVMPASGTFETGAEQASWFDPSSLGAIVTKSVRPVPRAGNPPPRIAETAAGLLNAVGIPSDGLDRFMEVVLPELRTIHTARIVSVAGETVEGFAHIARVLDAVDGCIDALELNLSCPNLDHGRAFATDEGLLRETVSAVRASTTRPIIAKLSPNVTDIARMGVVAQEAGADALSMINTIVGMAIDAATRKPVLGNVIGGLSGPAVKPVALRMVWETARAVSIPIIGMGGINNATDAVEFFLAGASAVAVGTGSFRNPVLMMEVIEGIGDYLDRNGFASIRDIVGLVGR